MEKNNNRNIVYEYKDIIADSSKLPMLLDGYKNFGWEIDRNLTDFVLEGLPGGANAYHKKSVVRLKRNIKIVNRVELTRLQHNFEANIREIDRLKASKVSSATMCALIIGLIGVAFMIFSILAFAADDLCIIRGIICLFPAFLGLTTPYFVFKNIVVNQTEKVMPLIEKKYDENYQLFEKGCKLLS